MKKKKCIVIEDYQSAYPDSFTVNKGEILKIKKKESDWNGWIWCVKDTGEGRWIPMDYLDIHENKAKIIKDYNAIELTVATGQILVIEKESYGWVWVNDENNNSGWIPLKNVKLLNE